MSDLEGTVGYSLPKICVLFPMVVGSRRIADDTETDERYLIYITDLAMVPIPYLLPALRGTFL